MAVRDELIVQKFLEIADGVGKESGLYDKPEDWNIPSFIGMMLQSCVKLCHSDLTPQDFEAEMTDLGATAILGIKWMHAFFGIENMPEDVDNKENIN